MDVSMQVKKAALRTALGYIEKDPEENLMKLMDWVDKLAGDGPASFAPQRSAFRNAIYTYLLFACKDTKSITYQKNLRQRVYLYTKKTSSANEFANFSLRKLYITYNPTRIPTQLPPTPV